MTTLADFSCEFIKLIKYPESVTPFPMDVLPQSILLHIFGYLHYKFVRKTLSLACKKWMEIAYDKTFIRNVKEEEFREINTRETLTETV